MTQTQTRTRPKWSSILTKFSNHERETTAQWSERKNVFLLGIFKVCLHVPSPSPSNCYHCANGTDCFTGGMGSVPILPVKQPISIGTMIKLDGDGHGHRHGDGDGTCKQTLTDEFSILTDRKKLLLMSLSRRCGGMSGVVAMSGGYRDRTLSSHGCKNSKMAK